MRFETCCFSGHRVIPKDVREPLREALEREIRFLIKCGLYCFCSGGAKGFDLMAAQIVLELKKENPRLELRMILPFREQAESWSPKEQEEYYSVLKLADRKEYVCGEKYSPGCYRKPLQWSLQILIRTGSPENPFGWFFSADCGKIVCNFLI